MADLNDSLHNAAAKPSREAPLSAIETRLRRRHRLRQSAVGVCALALIGVVGGGIALSSDDGPNVRTVPPAATQAYTTIAEPPISIELPDGWVESPIESAVRIDHEVFTVGSVAQPAGVAHNLCIEGPEYQDDVFVTMREFTAVKLLGDELIAQGLNPPVEGYWDEGGGYVERPADFATAAYQEVSCSNVIRGFWFHDAGRFFLAQISLGPTSSPERLTEAYAVLNSLVVTPIAISAGDPPISFELPGGWVESPLGLPNEHEVFAVGTAVQPSGVVHEVCRADPEYQDDVFVMLREFTARDLALLALDPQPGVSGIARLDYKPRPADFATEPREGGFCYLDSSSDLTAGTPVFSYVFQDGDRRFIADVSFGINSSAERQAEAFTVLNSIVVTPIGIPAPTVPPSTVPPSADTEAITAAFLGWIDTRPIDASGVYIEDFASIRDAVIGAAEANGHPDEYTGRVEAITRVGENDADVVYSFIIDGQPVVANLRGRAVKIDGVWLVSRDTVCEALLQGPVHCPPRS